MPFFPATENFHSFTPLQPGALIGFWLTNSSLIDQQDLVDTNLARELLDSCMLKLWHLDILALGITETLHEAGIQGASSGIETDFVLLSIFYSRENPPSVEQDTAKQS